MRWPTSRNEHSDVIFTGEIAVSATACRMTVSVEMHNTGDPELQRDVVAIVEHVLSDRRGDWRVLIVGSQETDRWEMKVYGPNSFERSYTLEGSAGEHEPRAVGAIISKIVPANR
jgi:hypothetical protein